VIQVLSAIATHTLALLVYPGLLMVAVFGSGAEIVWARVSQGRWVFPDVRWRRPSTVQATVALCTMLAAVQLAAPFNPVPSEERNLIVTALALAFTVWVELALTLELVPEPGLLLIIQFCWLLAVLGPAVQPESLRPQVLGNVLVPALMPLKVAAGLMYMLCLPALLQLWPLPSRGDRRSRARFNSTRALCWFPYCGLFTTLFFPPPGDDVLGLLRFYGFSLATAALAVGVGLFMRRQGAELVRRLYRMAVAPYGLVVLAVVVVTSIQLR
jgi:hypothetical protein